MFRALFRIAPTTTSFTDNNFHFTEYIPKISFFKKDITVHGYSVSIRIFKSAILFPIY